MTTDPQDMDDPINRIEWVTASELDGNSWNPNRVHKMELRLLESNILSTGWLQPILINRDNLIIDGFHRWRLAQDSKELRARYGGKVPVARLDLDRGEAMLLTIRINRAKGSHVASDMSLIVHELLEVHGYDEETIMRGIGATRQEVQLLAQDGVFSAAKIADWAYSPAWYPRLPTAAEAAAGEPETERPDDDGLEDLA